MKVTQQKNAALGDFHILYMHSQSKMTENCVFPGAADLSTLNWISELVNIGIQVAPKPQRDILSQKCYKIWVLPIYLGSSASTPSPNIPILYLIQPSIY